MTAILQVSDVLSRVRRLFGDADAVQIADTDVINWCNDAQDEIFDQLDDYAWTEAVMNTVASYDNSYSLPTNYYKILSVAVKTQASSTSYYQLKKLSLEEANLYAPGYRGSDWPQGTPQYWTDGPLNTIRLFPAPDTAITNGLRITYMSGPAALSSVNDVLSVPAYLRNAVVDYVMARCYEQDEDWNSADRKMQAFQDAVRERAERHKEAGVYPHILVSVDDYID